ncbi:MAG: hypothetical protein ACYC5A_02050 [Thermoleophilia bacterium]
MGKREAQMPIEYEVKDDGRFIHAVASGAVSSEELVAYEISHASDERIKSPLSELLEIKPVAFCNLTQDDVAAIFDSRKQPGGASLSHRCAVVVSPGDTHAWNLAKFYEGMAMLHSPEVMIVFGDRYTAQSWLGVD